MKATQKPIIAVILTLFMFILNCSQNVTQAQTICIGDFVFYDSNNNGVQDAGDIPYSNVRVWIYTEFVPGTYTNVGMTVTDMAGNYNFNNISSFLTAGTTYYITIEDILTEPGTTNPVVPTAANATGDANDSDASVAPASLGALAGKPYIEMVAGGTDKSNDFGFYTQCAAVTVDLPATLDVCEGETVDFNALASGGQAPYGFSWSDGTVSLSSMNSVTFTSSTIFSVTVTDQLGCEAVAETVIDVTRCPLDLSLSKSIAGGLTSVQAGQNITFEFEICNEGMSEVDSVEIYDYLPSGYNYVGSGWQLIASNSTFNTLTLEVGAQNGLLPSNGLQPGDCIVFPMTVEVDDCATFGNTENVALINFQRDFYGFTDDTDSSPGATILNEDDTDTAIAPIVDLALRKTVSSGNPPYQFNDPVTFELEIFNQGSVDLNNIQVMDYIPPGFILGPSNPGWTPTAGGAVGTLAGTIPAGSSSSLFITLLVQDGTSIDNWTNGAEILDALDSNGNSVGGDDFDSSADNNPSNDIGGVPNTGSDNEIDDNGDNKDGDAITDEDDHDREMIEVFDLALSKELVTAGPYFTGQNIQFDITVCNQGNTVGQNIVVNDYVPIGYTFVSSSNGGWSFNGTTSTASFTIGAQLAPGDCDVFPIFLVLNPITNGPEDWYNYAEIESSQDSNGNDNSNSDLDSNPGSDTGTENSVLPGDPDDNNIFGNGLADGEDEDDHDPAGITVIDLALRKTTSSSGPYCAGEVVTYNIEVFNQGGTPLQNITVIDHFGSGYSLAPSAAGTWTIGSSGQNATATITSVLNPGQSTVLSIPLVLECSDDQRDGFLNIAEIFSMQNTAGTNVSGLDVDSTPDGIPDNDFGGELGTGSDNAIFGNGTGSPGDTDPTTDEDDNDPAGIIVYDLALKNELISPTVGLKYGQPAEFRITVCNQGTIGAQNVQIAEYLPPGFSFAFADNTSVWSGTPTNPVATIPTIAVGECEEVSVFLTILDTPGGEFDYVTYAEVIASTDANGQPMTWDFDSTPGSNGGGENSLQPFDPLDNDLTKKDKGGIEDDHDPAGIELIDLALRKTTVNKTGPFCYGDVIQFDLEVFNQGSIQVSDIELTDFLPCGFALSPTSPGWTYSNATGDATIVVPGPLAPGTSMMVPIIVEIQQCLDTSPDSFTNVAEVSDYSSDDPNYPDPLDVDSMIDPFDYNDNGGTADDPNEDNVIDEDACVGGDEDDHDPERIEIFDLALIKQVVTINTNFQFGDIIEFAITVCNQGNVDAINIDITDYIPAGFALTPGMNPGWTGPAATPSYTIPDLDEDQCTSVPIFLTLIQTQGGMRDQWNYAEITGGTDDSGQVRPDADSNPGSNNGIESNVEPLTPEDNDIVNVDKGGEEDDHDVAGIIAFDLALRKTTANVGPFIEGDVVTFTITVFNQGNIIADNITVHDYIPAGFDYLASNNPTWTEIPISSQAESTINTPLMPGDSVKVTIDLEVTCTTDYQFGWDNYAEISAFTPEGNATFAPGDVDSNPDFVDGNDGGGLPLSPADDYIDGLGAGSPGSGIPQFDEDDHDPERIEIFDLALINEIVTTGPFKYGQLVEFEITVCNQGNIDAQNISIAEYLPPGFSFAFANNTSDWTGTAANPVGNIASIPINQCQSIPIFLTVEQSNGGEKDWITYAEIAGAQNSNGDDRTLWDFDSTPNSNTATENLVEPGDPADNDLLSKDRDGEEDDHDPAGIEVLDLALRKTTANQVGPYEYGDIVTFNFEVFNQGSIQTSGVRITDYIPCGFNYLGSNNGIGWNYTSTTGDANITLPNPIVPGSSATVTIQLEVQQCLDNDIDSFTNYAEVSAYTSDDPEYVLLGDIDSTIDAVDSNDNGGTPDVTGEDDNIDGDACQGEDEDDHDPERIEVFDLALKKELITINNPYAYGQSLQFNITVCNQGNMDAQNIEITDYIPAGYFMTPSANPTWGGSATNPTFNIPDLDQDQCITFPIFLTIQMTTGGEKDWVNYTEITDSQDDSGQGRVDADSNEGSDGPGENAVEPDHAGDDDLTSTDKGGEEDDHDPAGIEILDLAIRKTIANRFGPYEYGDIVTFNFEVFNQGSIKASGIQITDYIPCGFEYVAANNTAGWSYSALTGDATRTLGAAIIPGASATFSIQLRVQQCLDNDDDSFTNYVEISDYLSDDPDYLNPVDIDSMTDANDSNDEGGTPDDTNEDNVITGDKYQSEDEDDHDPERIEVFDLALKKELITINNPYAYGQSLQFNITVCNQGNVDARNIQITDYIPAGYFLTPGANPTWGGTATDPTFTIADLDQDQCTTFPIFLTVQMTTGGEKDWINYAEITDSKDDDGADRVDADSNEGSDGPGENAVEPDHNGDDDIESTDKGGEEDDHDPAGIELLDLAIRKTTVNNFGPFEYGDVVTFDFEVFNQGSIQASSIQITDYIPCGFAYANANNANGWSYNVGTGDATRTLPPGLVPGTSTTFTIDLIVQQCLDNDDDSFTNYVEISDYNSDDPDYPNPDDVDSMTDANDSNDTGGTPDDTNEDNVITGDKYQGEDEDDHDPERIEVFDLALKKELITINNPYAYGQSLRFNITVCNQGNVDAENIRVTDYIPAGYVMTPGANPSWGGTATDPIYPIANLDQDDCITFPIFLTIQMTTGGEKDWVNYAEITDSEDDNGIGRVDADSNEGSDGPGENAVEPDHAGDNDITSTDKGGEEDDHDPAGIELLDLALRKTLVTTGPHKYGDIVEFQIEVFNQGSIQASNISLADYIPCGIIYDPSNNGIGWSNSAGTASATLPGTLIPGNSTTIKFFGQLQECYSTVPDAWTNYGEISNYNSDDPDYPNPDDVDSNEDSNELNDTGGNANTTGEDNNINGDFYQGTDEDDHDPAFVRVYDLAITKESTYMGIDSIGPFVPGDTVDFRLTIYNQGNIDAYNVEITDYLNLGYSFDPSLNPGWALNAAGTLLQYTNPTPIATGANIVEFLKLNVIVTPTSVLGDWYNEVEISGGQDIDGVTQVDADSTPDTDPDNDNDLVDGPDDDDIFNGDENDEVIDEHIDDPFNIGDDDEDDNDAEEILTAGDIGDYVFKDLDGNSLQDSTDFGLENIVVSLFDCDDNLIEMDTTDVDGEYLFEEIIFGNYYVSFDISSLPKGCDFAFKDVGDDDTLDNDVDRSGRTDCFFHILAVDSTRDAGIFGLAKIGDRVWNDCNGNGIQDPSESGPGSGIPDVIVNVKDPATGETIYADTTDANGDYLVECIYPAFYYLEFVNEEGYIPTVPNQGFYTDADSDIDESNGPNTTPITWLAPWECDFDNGDAGLVQCTPIGELVWYDTNENDIYDQGIENGINGLEINLYRFHEGEWRLWETTLTGHKPGEASQDGYFKFCVIPGTYFVEYILPPQGLVAARPNIGFNESIDSDFRNYNGPNTTQSFTLNCEQENCNLGAGFYPMATVGDHAWMDDNNDGMRQAGESPATGILVEAYDINNQIVGSAITDGNGEYEIDYLQQEDYYLRFYPPAGYGLTQPDMGGDDNMDSDVNHANGFNTTGYYAMSPGDHTANVDAGFVFGVLPVELVSFTGTAQDRFNDLHWVSESEVNADYYSVERSDNDASNFSAIGEVIAKGSSSSTAQYEIKDYDVAEGVSYYYRLKMVDLDGTYQYSDIIILNTPKVITIKDDINMYPNPAKGSTNIDINLGRDNDVSIYMTDANGQLIKTFLTESSLKAGESKRKIMLDQIPSGMYNVHIKIGDEQYVRKLIVLEH